MQRVCFALQVKPDRLEEYRQQHASVWPEMKDALRQTGWGNYSLFLREDGLLIGYLETENFESARQAMSGLEVNTRWQQHMKPFFSEAHGLTADRAMAPLPEVFHLD